MAAEQPKTRTLQFGLNEDTLDRIKGSQKTGLQRLEEGDKTLLDTVTEGITTIETSQDQLKQDIYDQQVQQQNFDKLVAEAQDRGEVFSADTKGQMQTIYEEANKVFRTADKKTQAAMIESMKAHNTSGTAIAEVLDIAIQAHDANAISPSFLASPKGIVLGKIISQQDTEIKLNEANQWVFEVDGKTYTRKDLADMVENSVSVDFKPNITSFNKKWNRETAQSENSQLFNKNNMVRSFEDKDVFGNYTLKDEINKVLTASSSNLEIPLPASADGKYKDADTDGNNRLSREERMRNLPNEADDVTLNSLMTELFKKDDEGFYVYNDELGDLAGMYLTDLQVQNGAGAVSPPVEGDDETKIQTITNAEFNEEIKKAFDNPNNIASESLKKAVLQYGTLDNLINLAGADTNLMLQMLGLNELYKIKS